MGTQNLHCTPLNPAIVELTSLQYYHSTRMETAESQNNFLDIVCARGASL